MSDNQVPTDYSAHVEKLQLRANEITNSLWSQLSSAIMPEEGSVDFADMNYIVTSVCVGLFAQHNALLFTSGVEGRPHAEVQMLENFNEWYKITFPSLVKQLQESADGSKTS